MIIFEIDIKKSSWVDDAEKITTIRKRFSLPSSPSEITMRQWVDFLLIRDEFPKWMIDAEAANEKDRQKTYDEWTNENWIEFYINIGHALNVFIPDLDLRSLLSKNLSSEDGDSFLAIYIMLLKCIIEYRPKERKSFTWKGQKFMIPQSLIDSFGNVTIGAKLTTIEAIEALQLEHVFSGKDEKGEYILKDRKYHTDIALVAALCRKVTGSRIEKMPLDFQKRRAFMDKRIKLFSDLTMDVALDVAFFLINSKRALINTLTSALHLKTISLQQKMLKEPKPIK